MTAGPVLVTGATGQEIRDDPLIANPIAFQLFVQVPAEVNDGVPVIPARPPGIAALAQPPDQPNGLRSEPGLLPAHAGQPFQNASCIAHLHDSCFEVKRRGAQNLCDRRHMTDDHHGWTARRATPLIRGADEILGTHSHNSSAYPG
jgi:hypothetical protein